jgi:flagellar hook-associated protein 2
VLQGNTNDDISHTRSTGFSSLIWIDCWPIQNWAINRLLKSALALPIINYIIVFQKEKQVGISSPGIGSNLDVNGIVSKLLAVDSAPLTVLNQKGSDFQAKITALGTLSGAVSTLQSSLTNLSNPATFQSISSNSADTSVLVGSATNQASPGIYSINVTKIAQAQTIATAGQISTSSEIGLGGATTLSFQFGTVSGGSFGLAGGTLSNAVVSGGISNGSLSINGTTISTDSTTRSAKLLADAINSKSDTTGVTASAAATATSATLFGNSGASTFGNVDTTAGGTYALSVEGIQIDSQATGIAAGAGAGAASIDSILGATNATTDALTAANITHTGSAAAGTLQFFKADGANIAVTETITGTVNGGIGKTDVTANTGSSSTSASSVTISSTGGSPITVAGINPATAGLTAGVGGAYIGASYAQSGSASSGSVVIDNTNNSLQGIRDAVNKANIGVTATIISDGSDKPNHLVFTSSQTGASSSFKIGVSGSPADTALSDLLTYDPAGVQKLTQNTAAQSTTLNVNGIPVSSNTNTITGAIQGVTLTIGKVGNTNLSIARDSSAVKTGVSTFIKAYNDFNTAVQNLTSYDPTTKKAGVLLGDSTVQTIQTLVRKQLSAPISGLTGSLTNLSQVGISFQKDGSLTLDSGKLQTALTNNFSDIAGLFTSNGKSTDSLVSFVGSTAATKAGSYALNLTTLATQGAITGLTDLSTGTVTIAPNTTIGVTLNGTDPVTASTLATVPLTAGVYTAAQLATSIQSSINSTPAYSGSGVSVSATIDDGGHLVIKSGTYGSVSNISITSSSGTPVTDFLGDATSVDGVDVAGTIDGTPVTGSGQFLTGKIGTSSEGLKLQITGGAIGDRGTVNFSQGYAYQVSTLASTFLGTKGLITSSTDGLNSSIKTVSNDITDFNARLAVIEKNYRAQFTALDVTIGKLNSTQSFLTQQLAALTKSTA